MKKPEQRGDAELQFVQQGRTIEAIAEQLGISKTTIGRWSAAGKWADKRQKYITESPRAPLDKLYEIRRHMITGLPMAPDPATVDALNKLQVVIDHMEARAGNFGVALGVMMDFARFAAESFDADAVTVIRDAAQRFLAEMKRSASHG